ncbi:glycoside hydrolase family 15 protein [Micromonospora sp. NBC_01699]|uniref:glycoside hydrolase family 15 protein n=1 Tax=Micromonospora sp. NBC_01699 TaxID=2975984 RepID=UPI002E2A2BFA|nr:glycoside hydrolase family 15 protein [Micromonospora sp. NBC_01699]
MGNSEIQDHGLLADGRAAALVDRTGSVNWWCPSRFDGPSVFCRLLDEDGGHWSIRPRDPFRVSRAYLEGSLVLRTVFTTEHGSVAVTDLLALEPGVRGHQIGRRSPGVLVRVVEGLSGVVPLEMSYSPRFQYGRVHGYLVRRDEALVATAGATTLTMTGSVPMKNDNDDATARFRVGTGQRETFMLAYTPTYGEARPLTLGAPQAVDETVESWRSWARLHEYQGRYREQVRQHALVLQGLTYQPSGAIVAAATTSLPEQIGGDRNYDYRYAWLRDFSMTLHALWVAACPDEANRLFSWVASAVGQVGDRPVPIMSDVQGERDISERKVDTLRGYAQSRPVWIGNEAWRQRQLDVLGEVLDAAWLLRDYLDPMPDEVRDLLRSLADRAATAWREPDAGMWEARDAQRHYLSSKVFCWVALDRAVRFGERIGDTGDLARWSRARDEARETILRDGWNDEVGAYTGAFGSDQLDASVLVMPIVGFLPATDPRMRATMGLIVDRLSHGGLIRRWDGDPAAFFLCSFWMVTCLALAGERDRAAALFENLADSANDLGLFAEQIDPFTGAQLGNFPQAFSHIGLVLAAWQIDTASTGAMTAEGGN